MASQFLRDAASEHPWALATSAALVSLTAAYLQSPGWKLRSIPTVGGSSVPLLSYIGARRHFAHVQEWYEEGYSRYRGGFFKVPTLDRWMVIATGPTLIKEIANLPDDKLSFMAALEELLAMNHLGQIDLLKNQYHIDIVRRDLTRNLVVLFPEVYDEIAEAFNDYLPKTNDWTPIPAFNIATMIVARASNRILVGLPLCRNQEYLERCMMYTRDQNDSIQAVNKYPWYLKPLVAPFVNTLPATEKRVAEILEPEINRRKAMFAEYGRDYPDKPNDYLEWLLNSAYGDPTLETTDSLSRRVLGINFAAIHTSSSTWTHCLYTLSTHPEWIAPLREEVEQVFASEGITKAAMQKMVKLDSFFRECNRTNTIIGTVLTRVVLKSHTFSDGTFIPAGTFITVPTMPHQLDERSYDAPLDTQPFRFENVEDDTTRKYFTTADSRYMAFGLGKHACPGRFFAGNELKCMMAQLILHYDIKSATGGVRPPNVHMAGAIMPDMQANIMLRKRQK